MATHGTGTFEVKTFDETTYQEIEGKRKLTQGRGTQTFHGAIEGEATVEYLMAYGDDDSAAIVGLLRVVGRVGDKSGSAVLQIVGQAQGHTVSYNWTVVPGTGTGALHALRGTGGCPAWAGMTAEYTLDYDFE